MKERLGLGPAFPILEQYEGSYGPCKNTYFGMSKRLHIACNILQGLMSNPDSDSYHLGDGVYTDSSETKVRFCYILADELLKQESE